MLDDTSCRMRTEDMNRDAYSGYDQRTSLGSRDMYRSGIRGEGRSRKRGASDLPFEPPHRVEEWNTKPACVHRRDRGAWLGDSFFIIPKGGRRRALSKAEGCVEAWPKDVTDPEGNARSSFYKGSGASDPDRRFRPEGRGDRSCESMNREGGLIARPAP